jgi:2-octaprenyl-6-methoxyphenol hydroxylase
MNMNFDVVVCGAGPVGLSTVALLVKRGVAAERIAIIDGKSVDLARKDPRSIALSEGSHQILARINAWPQIAPAATEIHQIHISRKGYFGRTFIDRKTHALSALGFVTRYGVVVSALSDVIAQTQVQVIRPARIQSIAEDAQGVDILMEDGQALRAKIAVQAEGGVFGQQLPRALQRDYDQVAIVCHVRVSNPIWHRAYERFTAEGPLALLPQEDGYALVWCVRPDHAQTLLQQNDAAFLQSLGAAFGSRVGEFCSASPRHSFPLGLNAHTSTTARTVAIGNAAQTLHPVAGQGLNLGLRDAAVLAKYLAKSMDTPALQQFMQSQKLDRSMTIQFTDVMARIFADDQPGSMTQSLLGLSLGLLDGAPILKHFLAQHMMYGHR